MRRTVTTNRAGQSLVEFALLATVLFTLLIGIFEFGRAYYYYSAIVNAAQEGARYGSVTGVNTTAKRDAIISDVITSTVAVDVTSSNVTISCAGSCSSVGAGGQFTVSVGYTFTAVTPLVPSFQINGQSSMMIDHSP
jgi:Flp pilus assembly protein TadG